MSLLTSGEWEAEFRARVGGSLSALRLRGIDVLRPFPDSSVQPLDASSFPLVPFCNRVAQGRFRFGGREVTLRPNHPPEPHRLHGIGWHRPWEVSWSDEAGAMLVHEIDGKRDWPWAYRAEQALALDTSGLTAALRMTNRAAEAMPAGLGFHPYFRRRSETVVRFGAARMIEVGADMIPTGETSAADRFARWSEGTALPAETVDHCFTDWDGTVRIEDDLGTITLTASGAPHLHVYAPADGSALCFEPVNHLPDALNQAPETMPVIAPGESLTLEMRIEAALR